MLKFFIKHKKVRGAITMFLTIIYMATYFMTGALVDGGRIKMGHAIIEDAQQIATENIMAQYHKGLYELYGLFGTSGYSKEEIETSIKAQMEEILNLKLPDSVLKSLSTSEGGDLSADIANRFDPFNIKVEDIDVNALSLTSENIDLVRAQMRDEVKYDSLQLLVDSSMPAIEKIIQLLGAIGTIQLYFELLTTKITTKSPVADLIKEFEKSEKEFTNNYRTIIQTFYINKEQPDDEGVGYITYSSRGFLQDTQDKFIEGKSVENMSEKEAEDVLNKFEGEVNKELEESEKVKPDEGEKKVDNYKKIRMDERKGELFVKFDSSDIGTGVYENPDDEYAFLYNNEEYTYGIAAQNNFRDEESRKWPDPKDDKYKDKNEEEADGETDDDTSEDLSQDDDSNNDEQSDGKSGEERYIEDVIACADARKSYLLEKINKIGDAVDSAIENLKNAYTKEEEFLETCSSGVVQPLVDRTVEDNKGNKMDKMIDKYSLSILAGQIESNLVTWQKTAEKIDILKSTEPKFKAIRENIQLIKEEIESITETIKADVASEGLSWKHNSSYHLGNKPCVEEVHRNIRESADELMRPRAKTFDAFAYITKFLLSFTKTLKDMKNKVTEDSDGVLFEDRWHNLYIKKVAGKQDGAPFTYTIDSHIETGEQSEMVALLKFIVKAIIDPLGAVSDYIKDVVDETVGNIAAFGDIDNYYEIAYIMSNCRDFVHTYWYNNHIGKRASTKMIQARKGLLQRTGEFFVAGGALYLNLWTFLPKLAFDLIKDAWDWFTGGGGIMDLGKNDWVEVSKQSIAGNFGLFKDRWGEFMNAYGLVKMQYDDDTDLDIIMNEKFVNEDLGTEFLTKKDFEGWEVNPLEIEYILSKRKSTKENNKKILNDIYNRILRFRTLVNYISAWTSPACAKDMTTIISSSGPACIIVAPLIPLLYALPESYVEAEYIMRCKQANFFNGLSNIRLWSGFSDLATIAFTIVKNPEDPGSAPEKEIDQTSEEMQNTMNKMLTYENMETEKFLELVRNTVNQKGNYSGIINGVDKLAELKRDKIYDTAEVDRDGDDLLLQGIEFAADVIEGGVEKGTHQAMGEIAKATKKFSERIAGPIGYQPRGIQVGYTFYLFLFLLMGSGYNKGQDGRSNKDKQIGRFLDVVETNVKRGLDPNFELENTYLQISAKTTSSMKYIFMTQSFVKQLLEKKAIDIGDRFSVTTKTAFGY